MGSAGRRRPEHKIRRAAAAMRGHTGARPRDTLVKAAPSRGPSRSLRVGSSPGASRASRSVSAPPHAISSKPPSDAREAWWPPRRRAHLLMGSAPAAPSSSAATGVAPCVLSSRGGPPERSDAHEGGASAARSAERGPTRPNDSVEAPSAATPRIVGWDGAQVVAGLLGYGEPRRGAATRRWRPRDTPQVLRGAEPSQRCRVPKVQKATTMARRSAPKLVGVLWGSFMPPKGCR